MTGRSATPDAYFDEVWSMGDDPWDHGGRWYETRKYEITAAVLPRSRYLRSFEPGCGAGFLTRRLASRSNEHLAMERHPNGVAATAARCVDLPTVTVVRGEIPRDWPTGAFDLIVLSEILYYLGADALQETFDRAEASLTSDGDLVAVHYRPDVADHTWTGSEVHDLLLERGWSQTLRLVDDHFLLDVLRR